MLRAVKNRAHAAQQMHDAETGNDGHEDGDVFELGHWIFPWPGYSFSLLYSLETPFSADAFTRDCRSPASTRHQRPSPPRCPR